MKVFELIAVLLTMPENLPVMVWDINRYGHAIEGEAGSVQIDYTNRAIGSGSPPAVWIEAAKP